MNIQKITNDLGLHLLQVTFKQGLADTIQWYQDNDAWLQRVISGEYQDYMKEQYQ